MVLINGNCWNCSKEIGIYVGQSVYDKELWWHEEYSCPYCGSEISADDRGIPPEEIRQAILGAEGRWNLNVQEAGSRAIAAAKLLRKVLGLSLNEAMVLKNKMPGSLFSGTKAEMDRLRQILVADGFNAWIAQCCISQC